jgi:hypothetical protein
MKNRLMASLDSRLQCSTVLAVTWICKVSVYIVEELFVVRAVFRYVGVLSGGHVCLRAHHLQKRG